MKVKGPDGYLWRWGACALREELKDMTEPQLQGCYRALVEVLDGSPTNAPGLKDEVLAAVKRMRGHVREWIDLARQRHEDATAKLPVATDLQSATSAEQAELDRTQLRRQARRESERKAYQLLLDHGDWLAQPCERPLVTAIPFGCRALVVARWARCVDDLISATHNRLEAERKGQGVEAATVHEVGAWVILLRIFPMALLRQFGGGGRAAERRMKKQIDTWDSGGYIAAAFMPIRARVVRRSRRAGRQRRGRTRGHRRAPSRNYS